jgi:hypothetical protein
MPISITLTDQALNSSTLYTMSPTNTPGVDTVPPSISSVSFTPDTGTLKIDGVLQVNITAGESGLHANTGDVLVNGVQTTGFTNTSGNNYTAQYTIVQNNQDQLANSVPVHVVVRDPAGNASATWSDTPGTTPSIDAHVPIIYSINFNTDSSQMTVVFTEAVFKNPNGTGNLVNASISSIVDQAPPGNITGSLSGSPNQTGPDTVVYNNVTWTGGTPVANVDQIVVTTAASQIYDAVGNMNPGNTTGTGTAGKLLRMFGAPQTVSSARRSASSLVSEVRSWIQTSILGDRSSQASPAAAAPVTAQPVPVSAEHPAQVPRTQFYEPILTADVQTPTPESRAPIDTLSRSEAPQVVAVAPAPAASNTPDVQVPGTTRSLPTVASSQGSMVNAAVAPQGSGVLPAWWILGLGILAAGLATAGAWMALRFVRQRGGK